MELEPCHALRSEDVGHDLRRRPEIGESGLVRLEHAELRESLARRRARSHRQGKFPARFDQAAAILAGGRSATAFPNGARLQSARQRGALKAGLPRQVRCRTYRADQAALTFAGDSKWVELGIAKDSADAIRLRNLLYDFYLSDFLRRFSKLATFTEAHERGHLILVNKLLEKGAIAWVAKDGVSAMTPENQVLIETKRRFLALRMHC